MAGDPSKLLIAIFAVITIVPIGLIVYETKLIQGLKKQIAELNSQLVIENNDSCEEDSSDEKETAGEEE